MIHDLVGIACKAIGRQQVQRVWPACTDTSLRAFLDRLSHIDELNKPAEEVIQRDHAWARQSYRLRFLWESLVQRSTFRASEESFRARHLRSEAEVRLLHADVAIELFRRQNDRLPVNLAELVPRHFKTVPLDPFSNKPMVYRRTTNSYLLYSVGPDRKNDGGKPLTRGSFIEFGNVEVEKGDLLSTPAR